MALVGAACGQGDATPTPTSPPTPTPTASPTPSPQATLVVRPTPSPTPEPATGSPGPELGYTWTVSTVDEFAAKPSLAVDSSGAPHIAYIREAMPGFVRHATPDADGGWNISTVAEGYYYGPLDIVLDDRGRPHVSWHNHDREDQAYAVLLNGRWTAQDIAHPGHDGWDGTLALDSRGRPHTASIDPSQFGSESGYRVRSFRWDKLGG